MKTADEVIEGQAVEVGVEAETRPWAMMDSAPVDGTIIECKADPDDAAFVLARWYGTRVRDQENRRWVPAGWWVDPVTKGRLEIEPFCWRMMEGFVAPGMVAA